MALEHSNAAEVIDLKPYGNSISSQKNHALFKSRDLELIRITLQAGEQMPEHRVAGEITLHCLEGSLRVATPKGDKTLEAGQLLHLLGDSPHALTAITACSVLLTIALK